MLFGDPFVSVVFSSWFVAQILFEVDTLSEVWYDIELYDVSFGSWRFMILVEPMHNYLLNSFSMDMVSRLAIMVSC